MYRLFLTLFCLAVVSTAAFAQEDHNDAGQLLVGYAVVTPTGGAGNFGTGGGLVVFETFGWRSEFPALQAGVLPATMTTRTVIFASSSVSLGRNVGVAITNPGTTDAVVTLTLRRANGTLASSKTVAVASHRQIARFVSELFADMPEVASGFDGSLTLTSTTPVAILALRFRGTNFSTIPITSLSPAVSLPEVTPGIGGSNAVLLPQFVADGLWASEIVVLNNGTVPLTVRIDTFRQDGTPMVSTLNHQTGSSFPNLTIAPGGIVMFAPRSVNGDSDF